MTIFYGDKSRPFWNLVNSMDNDFVYKLGVKLQNIEWQIRHAKLFWYILRWQMSTPILWFVFQLLGDIITAPLYAVIIANFVGALVFYKVDELIFKRN